MPSAIYPVHARDALARAEALSRQLGVRAVTLDPVRGQLVVRYAPEQTSEAQLRLSLQAASGEAPADRLLTLWPHLLRLSKVVSALS